MRYYEFIFLSFAAFALFFAVLRPYLIRPERFAVRYQPSVESKLFFLIALVGFLVWMSAVFIRDYSRISYAGDPQIPDFLFAIGFKEMPIVNMVLFACVRRHSKGATERIFVGGLLVYSLWLFSSIAGRAGNRTDILALLLGVAVYELYPFFVNQLGGMAVRLTAARVRALLAIGALGAAGLFMMFNIQSTRERGETGLPTYATVLYNDYYTPAHMLMAAIGFGYTRPIEVLKSNLANAFFFGRVPYLQTELGNMVRPGSSSRSASFGFYVFTEGYLALGRWGFLYNGIVPLLGIALWRLPSSSDDRLFNAFGTALAAMFFANIARSQTMLLVRDFYFFLIPALVLFAIVTGARPRRLTMPSVASNRH
jgi:hypothetical protein